MYCKVTRNRKRNLNYNENKLDKFIRYTTIENTIMKRPANSLNSTIAEENILVI